MLEELGFDKFSSFDCSSLFSDLSLIPPCNDSTKFVVSSAVDNNVVRTSLTNSNDSSPFVNCTVGGPTRANVVDRDVSNTFFGKYEHLT